ncbi:DUF4019 domain-containing protein [Novosphingobium album (ex Liu et al. 2023)]|uniref:DUF4019 domain-containing protein n=1 Tax=Novosphingobium album (ex Liu et al. 2023) TaxID=3031130 RepID=A0ABT5WJI4_9SPHN|nr:DUF4019 domain-containing protein [Novosphingobium album (ex Liu et al. 2023)]MDE8650207.1 DUF4019 domain-containing protein [Novosphingobium album (ex Liu et al. 2023)]
MTSVFQQGISQMRYLLAFLCLLFAVPATAQDGARDVSHFLNAAVATSQSAGQGGGAQLWEGASPILKRSVTRDAFAKALAKRTAFGAVRAMDWSNVSHVRVTEPGRNLPMGEYVTVSLVWVNATNTVLKEQVSFVLDTDKVWRLCGYFLE